MRYLHAFVLALMSAHTYAQTNTAQVLSTARADQHVLLTQQLMQRAAELPKQDIFLRSIEGRVGINGSTLGDTIYGYVRNEDSYGLILTTNSLRELRHQRRVIQSEVTTYSAAARVKLEDAVLLRYQSLVDAFYLEQQLAASQELISILEERSSILRSTAEAGLAIKPADVIKTERDRLRAAAQHLELEQRKRTAQASLSSFLPEPGSKVNFSGFIRLRQMLSVVQAAPSITAVRPEVAVRQQETQLEQAKLAYIRSQDRQIFQSLRLGYDRPLYLVRPNKFNTQNNLSVRVGLAVPLPGNHRFQETRARISMMEAELKATLETQKLDGLAAELSSRITELCRFYQALETQQSQSLIPTYLSDQALKAALSPLDINELQQAALTLQSTLIETEYEVAKLYIAYLQAAGLLIAEPFVNFLDAELKGW